MPETDDDNPALCIRPCDAAMHVGFAFMMLSLGFVTVTGILFPAMLAEVMRPAVTVWIIGGVVKLYGSILLTIEERNNWKRHKAMMALLLDGLTKDRPPLSDAERAEYRSLLLARP